MHVTLFRNHFPAEYSICQKTYHELILPGIVGALKTRKGHTKMCKSSHVLSDISTYYICNVNGIKLVSVATEALKCAAKVPGPELQCLLKFKQGLS